MHDCDFEYAGQCLSDFGFIVCDFNGPSGADVVSAGSNITFNTTRKYRGKKYSLTSTQYDECVTATFDICKDPNVFTDPRITNDEYRDLMRWLNRREYLPFRVIPCNEESDVCYFDASFNINKIEVNRELYGLQLTMTTNAPFGYGQELIEEFEILAAGTEILIQDKSDEIGFLYPNIQATCSVDGDFSITNETAGITMQIKNCTAGEVITISGDTHIIQSSDPAHAVYDDFNYVFLYIENTYMDRDNVLSVGLPCLLELRYKPIIKGIP